MSDPDNAEMFTRASEDLGRAASGITRAGGDIARSSTAMTDGAEKQAAAMTDISRRLQALTARCEEVGQVIEVLDDFARQTNVLALNAALEASRAGDRGKGFAVVAEEVRKLAERSGATTRDVGAAIQAIEASAGEAARAIDDVRTIARSLTEGAAATAAGARKLLTSAQALSEALAKVGVRGRPEGDLLDAVEVHRDELARVLETFRPLVNRGETGAGTPLAGAVRQLLDAVDGGRARTNPDDHG